MENPSGQGAWVACSRAMTSPASNSWLLRPGVRVVRRSPTQWQVGLPPGARLALPDSAAVRTLLQALALGEPVPPSEALSRLVDAGLLIRRSVLEDLLPSDRPGQQQAAALAARAGGNAAAFAWAREEAQVEVRTHGRDALFHADALRAALSRAGMCAKPTRPRPSVVVLVSDGQFSRTRTDRLMREDIPHLPVVLHQGAWLLGPFVDPGVTACQRCVDHSVADRDPRWPLLVEQSARCHDPRDLPSPADPTLTQLAVALAVAQVTAWVEGAPVPTWSATIRVDHDLDLSPRPWPRHPACGCTWADLEAG